MRFCGAMRPLYLVRDGQIKEYEKNVMSIGDEAYENQVDKLQQYDENLEPGDTLYMFSDGYETQPGGEGNKPLGKRKFRELIQEASRLPLGEQGQFLDEALEKWKGREPQLDDICIVAVTT